MVTLFLLLLALAVLGAVAAVAAGLISGGMDDPASSVPVHELPAGPLSADQVRELRFSGALRGYRMDQVDQAMDRMQGELARRDTELTALRAELDQARRAVPGRPPGWPTLQAPAARQEEWPLPGVGRMYEQER